MPTEVLVFHRMRGSFVEFRTRMSLLVSLVEFAQRFGAGGQGIESTLEELEDLYSEARDLYLRQELAESEEAMDVALERFGQAKDEARALKDRALLWTYLVEWLVTTAALMVCSFTLWALMVRRKLYRTVSITRMRTS